MPDGFARFPLPPPRGLEAAPSPPPRARAAPAGSAASLQRAAFARAPRTSDAASVCPPQGRAVPQLGRPEPRGRRQWQRPSGSVSCDAPSTHRGVAAAAIRHIVSHLRRGRLVPGRGRRRGGGGSEKKGRLRAEWRLRSPMPLPVSGRPLGFTFSRVCLAAFACSKDLSAHGTERQPDRRLQWRGWAAGSDSGARPSGIFLQLSCSAGSPEPTLQTLCALVHL